MKEFIDNAQESARDATLAGQAAFNGLRANLHDRRAAGAEAAGVEAQRSADFYAELGDRAIDGFSGIQPRGTVAPESNPLSAHASGYDRYRNAAIHHTSDPKVWAPTPATAPAMTQVPGTFSERRDAIKAARELARAQDLAKDQARRVKTFGGHGPVAPWARRAAKVQDYTETNRAFANGDIDAFEVEQRRQDRRLINPTKSTLVEATTARRIENTIDEVSTQLSDGMDRAEKSSLRAARKQARQEAKAEAARIKQAEAVAKRAARRAARP